MQQSAYNDWIVLQHYVHRHENTVALFIHRCNIYLATMLAGYALIIIMGTNYHINT